MLRSLVIFLAAGILALAPFTASAATTNFFGPIVPSICNCPGSAPDWGCVLQTFQNLINFTISIGVVIVTLIAAYAGILLITSPFNAENKSKARSMLMSSVIGLVIIASAWLIVDFVMKALYSPEAAQKAFDAPKPLPWNSILGEGADEESHCLDITAVVTSTSNQSTTPAPTGTGSGSQAPDGLSTGGGSTSGSPSGCTNCVKVTSVPHKDAPEGCDLNGGNDGVAAPNPAISSCYVSSSIYSKLTAINASGWQVTEMWPPTRNHDASCHNIGTCVDASFISDADKSNSEKILALLQKASAAGITPIYEFKTTSACTAFTSYIAQNSPSLSSSVSKLIDVVGNQTGNGHFSFYNSSSDAINTPGCN